MIAISSYAMCTLAQISADKISTVLFPGSKVLFLVENISVKIFTIFHFHPADLRLVNRKLV
jgi:hypothetical protein